MDRPTADQLRVAIETSRARLTDLDTDEARYLQRVASNLEAILEREARLLPEATAETIASFSALIGEGAAGPTSTPDAEAASLRHAIDSALRDGLLSPTDDVLQALRDDADRRLAIARPDYLHRAP